MPQSRDIPRQHIGEPTFEPSTQTENMERSENITNGDLDELETKLDLKLTKIQFQLQEQLNEIKKIIENVTNSNRNN